MRCVPFYDEGVRVIGTTPPPCGHSCATRATSSGSSRVHPFRGSSSETPDAWWRASHVSTGRLTPPPRPGAPCVSLRAEDNQRWLAGTTPCSRPHGCVPPQRCAMARAGAGSLLAHSAPLMGCGPQGRPCNHSHRVGARTSPALPLPLTPSLRRQPTASPFTLWCEHALSPLQHARAPGQPQGGGRFFRTPPVAGPAVESTLTENTGCVCTGVVGNARGQARWAGRNTVLPPKRDPRTGPPSTLPSRAAAQRCCLAPWLRGCAVTGRRLTRGRGRLAGALCFGCALGSQ